MSLLTLFCALLGLLGIYWITLLVLLLITCVIVGPCELIFDSHLGSRLMELDGESRYEWVLDSRGKHLNIPWYAWV